MRTLSPVREARDPDALLLGFPRETYDAAQPFMLTDDACRAGRFCARLRVSARGSDPVDM
jgi:hypothetical protein